MNIDELVSSGVIRPHVAEHIRAKTASIVKRAKMEPPTIAGGAFDLKNALMYTALGSAAAFGIPMAANLLGRGAAAVSNAAMKPIRYRRMMKEHPELGDIDQKTVRRGFDTLNRFSPDLAADPNVASAFIHQQAVHSLLGPDVARSLVGTQKQYTDQRRSSALQVQPVPQFGEMFLRAGEGPQAIVNKAYYESMGRQSGSQHGLDPTLARQQSEMEEEGKQLSKLRHAQEISRAQETGTILGRSAKLDAIEDIGKATGSGQRAGQITAEERLVGAVREIQKQKQRGTNAVGPGSQPSPWHGLNPQEESYEKEMGKQIAGQDWRNMNPAP